MNLIPILKKSVLPAAMVLILALITANPLNAQDQKVKEKSGGKKTIKLQVVTDENGKVTKLDTTITAEGDEGMNYEYHLEGLEDQMKDLEEQMENMKVTVDNGLITITETDSTGGNDSVRKHIIVRRAPGHMKMEMPDRFMYFNDEDVPCPPMPGWCDDESDGFFRGQLPPEYQSLLESITLGHITGFKVIDRKGGKRVIIDMDDNPVMMMRPVTPKHRHAPQRIVIEKNVQAPAPPDAPVPPPPPPPKEQQTPQGKKG
jgi:hypothetical protein